MGVFACARKDRLVTRSGTPYLALELRDRTGAIPARAFRDADVLAGRFERGDLVRVAGRVERFRDELQLEVRAITRVRPGDDRPGAVPAGRLPRPRRARRLPRAPRARGPRPRLRRAARTHCSATTSCAPNGAARRARAAATTPTSAACSSTPSPSATLAHRDVHPAPAAEQRPARLRGARPRPRQDARVHLRRGDRPDRGRPAARPRRARRAADRRARARDGARRRPARSRSLHCVLLHHGADAAAGRRFASAEALALHRLNALDASVKGALEHGLQQPG